MRTFFFRLLLYNSLYLFLINIHFLEVTAARWPNIFKRGEMDAEEDVGEHFL